MIPTGLLPRLEIAARQAIASGEVGTPRSIRLHVGAPDAPPLADILAFADAIFGPDRAPCQHAPGASAMLCLWRDGRIATISTGVASAPLAVLTLLGTGGALHFQQGGA